MKKIIFASITAAFLFSLIACGTTSEISEEVNENQPEAPVTEEIEENAEDEVIEAVIEEIEISNFDENGLPIGEYVCMEDFEDGNYWMPVGSSWNDGDTSIDDETTEEWGTAGPTSLKCLYTTNHAEFEKAGFYCDAPLESDWTGAKYVVVDVNNPNDYDITIDIVLQTGDNWGWNQAEAQVCPPGVHTLVFDISKASDTDQIIRMIVYLFGTPEDSGYFYFDNYRVVF